MVDMDKIAELYTSGFSISQISKSTGTPLSTVRFRLKRLGILRTRKEGLMLASSQGRLGGHMVGVRRDFTDEHKKAISVGRKRWAEVNSVGTSTKPSGYLEYTRGPHKGRSVHVVKMEKRIGRRLKPNECVHHKDEDRANNKLSNLELMTRSEHARLHRSLEAARGQIRDRKPNGKFR